MQKEITLGVSKHIAKFIISHADYEVGPDGVVFVPKISELGRLIHCMSIVIPYNQKPVTLPGEQLTLRYTCRTKAFDVPTEKYRDLARLLDEMFRSSLIRQVSAIQSTLGQADYSWVIRRVLDLHDIVVDDDKAKDVDFDRIRKIYRDHLNSIQKKNQAKRRLSATLLSA